MPGVLAGAPGTLPVHSPPNSRRARDCIFASDYERHVLTTRKYAGIRVVDRYRISNRLKKTL